MGFKEKRGNTLTIRGLSVLSRTLGISGQCDVVEFHQAPNGVPLSGREGLWLPYPIEYKRGSGRSLEADRLQLCTQAMCLEEMLCCSVPEGALYYGETKRRTPVSCDETLCQTVRTMLEEMHRLYSRGHTPKVRPTKACNACSLKELCLPALMRKDHSAAYLREELEGSL